MDAQKYIEECEKIYQNLEQQRFPSKLLARKTHSKINFVGALIWGGVGAGVAAAGVGLYSMDAALMSSQAQEAFIGWLVPAVGGMLGFQVGSPAHGNQHNPHGISRIAQKALGYSAYGKPGSYNQDLLNHIRENNPRLDEICRKWEAELENGLTIEHHSAVARADKKINYMALTRGSKGSDAAKGKVNEPRSPGL